MQGRASEIVMNIIEVRKKNVRIEKKKKCFPLVSNLLHIPNRNSLYPTVHFTISEHENPKMGVLY